MSGAAPVRRASAMPPVPFLDLKAVNARFDAEMANAVGAVLASGWYLLGEQNRRFAAEFARFCGSAHCVPLANGLDALRLTLRAWMSFGRLQPGDEVIVPANSFVASALAVTDSNLALRFADVDAGTFCVTRDTIAASLTGRTRVVMPVHLFGQVDDIAAVRALCEDANVLVLEDAAQAHGARFAGRHSGTFGDAGAFSFYPSKNLGALGDAGCMVTDDGELAERVRMLGNYGSTRKYEHEHCGINSRMDELQAAVLRIKLTRLDADNARRREIARRYNQRIAHPQVRTPRPPSEDSAHAWHLYVVRVPRRASFIDHLNEHGIETMIHYPHAIHRQPAYRAAFSSVRMPVAEALQDEVLSLPMSPVMTDEQVDRVVAAVNAWPGPSSSN
ncbi:MAG: DegT/DnrJ/EryC1/StrS family aminotransferase [Burkholderiales bacterium]